MDANAAREFFRQYEQTVEDIWLEKQFCRKLILDRGVMSEPDLDAALDKAKRDPANRMEAADHFAPSWKTLAEFGMRSMVEGLSSKPAAKEKQN